MEQDFIHVAAAAEFAVANTVSPIFQDFGDGFWLYLTNVSDDINLSGVTRFWFIGIAWVSNGTLQEKV